MCGTQCKSPLGCGIISLNRAAGTAVEVQSCSVACCLSVAHTLHVVSQSVCCRSAVYSTVAAKRLTAGMKSGDDCDSEDEFSVRQSILT